MTANPTNLASAVGLRPGDKIDKYEVVQQIGAGGFSVVWKAYDRLLDKHVAVKQVTIDSSVDEETFRERFRSEAVIQKKAAEEHKHLVRIIDFIEDPRGLFIIMEYVDGPSLEHLLAQNPGPVDVKTALGIAAAAAVALGAIHDKGIVHRDLKPANILLPSTGGLKICDFGLASLMADQETPAVGTVRYMAPELLNAQKVDGRADIYSLGLILYEMLIGRANFEDAFKIVLRDQRNVALRWMKWHTNLKVKATPIRQYVPAVPEPIAQLVERMMEKDANQRIASASQLLEAMRRQLSAPTAAALPAVPGNGQAGRPAALATAGPVGDKTVKVQKKNKLVLVAAVTVVIWSILGIGYVLYNKKQANDQIRAQQNLVRDDYIAATKVFGDAVRGSVSWDQASDALKGLLRDHEDHHGVMVPVYGDKGKPLSEAVRGHLAFADARREFDLRNYDKALELLDKAEANGSVDMNHINKLRDDAVVLRSVEAMEQQILAEVGKGNFFGAQHQWQKFRQGPYKSLPEEQQTRWDDLLLRINAQRQTKEAEAILAEARRLTESDPKAAVALLEDWRAKPENVDNPNRMVDSELAALKGASEFDNALARGKSAEQREDWALAIESYDRAAKQNRTKAESLGLPTMVRKIKARVALSDGMKALTANDVDAAIGHFQRALAEDPELAEAKRELEKLDNASKMASLKRQAVAAHAGGEYDKAINYWKQLGELGEDPNVVAGEIAKAQLQIAIGKMEQAWSGDSDDAAMLKAIDGVMALDSANARATTLKTLIETRKRIKTLIASGDALRNKGEYGDAKRDLRRAQDIAKGIEDTTIRESLLGQATEHLNDVEYIDAYSKAKRDFELDKLDTARAWAINAVRTKGTDEAKALLSRIEAAIAKKAS